MREHVYTYMHAYMNICTHIYIYNTRIIHIYAHHKYMNPWITKRLEESGRSPHFNLIIALPWCWYGSNSNFLLLCVCITLSITRMLLLRRRMDYLKMKPLAQSQTWVCFWYISTTVMGPDLAGCSVAFQLLAFFMKLICRWFSPEPSCSCRSMSPHYNPISQPNPRQPWMNTNATRLHVLWCFGYYPCTSVDIVASELNDIM